jgi:hypothetical protein
VALHCLCPRGTGVNLGIRHSLGPKLTFRAININLDFGLSDHIVYTLCGGFDLGSEVIAMCGARHVARGR